MSQLCTKCPLVCAPFAFLFWADTKRILILTENAEKGHGVEFQRSAQRTVPMPEIRGARRLQPLLAGQANADVGLLDHRDVVPCEADHQRKP